MRRSGDDDRARGVLPGMCLPPPCFAGAGRKVTGRILIEDLAMPRGSGIAAFPIAGPGAGPNAGES